MKGRALLYKRIEHEDLRDVVNAVAVDRLGLGFGGAGYSRGVKVLGIRNGADSAAISHQAGRRKGDALSQRRPFS